MVVAQFIKRKILVIEDNEINREILNAILSPNYEVIEAVNGKEGLQILEKDPTEISLIVLDIQMPVMSGFEFLEVYKVNNQLKQIPVIVTTAEESEEEKCLMLGASDFVSKPYNPNIVLRRIEALIRLRESTFALQRTKFEPLSGLLNKEYFAFVSEMNLEKFRSTEYCFVLIQIEDLNIANTLYGEENCNSLIKFIGKTLASYNNEVTFARYSGDKFVCYFDKSVVKVEGLIENLKQNLNKNTPITKVVYKFAVYDNPDHDLKTSVIVNRLIGAIKDVFHNFVKDIIYFDNAYIKKEEVKHIIEENMEDSLKNNDFIAYFQPKHDTKTGELKGAEALVRWVHPQLGFISPGDFIPYFEQNGFITKLDIYVLEATCRFLAQRIAENKKVVPTSINLSRRDLVSIESTEVFDKILEKYNIDKSLIHFEITESMCEDSETVIKKTKMIRDAGYQIEVDDFGTGYSSLGMITDVPMDYLKLDLSFIKKICSNREFAKTVFNIARVLNVKTVAEGVETEEEIAVCKELGCDYIQGYYYSKPLSPQDFSIYLEKELN